MRLAFPYLFLLTLAFTVQPGEFEISSGVGSEQTYVVSFINDEVQQKVIRLREHEFSSYLNDYVELSEHVFILQPQETRNIRVQANVPPLGPQRHAYIIQAFEEDQIIGQHSLYMPVVGTARHQLQIELQSQNYREGRSMAIPVKVANYGNVNEIFQLTLHISQRGNNLANIAYPYPLQILAGEELETDLLVTNSLPVGPYDATVQITTEDREISETSRIEVHSLDRVTVTIGNDVDVSKYLNDVSESIALISSSGKERKLQINHEGERTYFRTEGIEEDTYDVYSTKELLFTLELEPPSTLPLTSLVTICIILFALSIWIVVKRRKQ